MLFESLITPEIAFVATAIITFMLALGRIPTDKQGSFLNKTYAWKNFGWLLTVGLGIAAAFLPGVCPIVEQGWGSQVVWGIVAGGTAMLGHKALKPVIVRKLEN